MRNILWVLAAMGLTVSYQNCQKVDFDGSQMDGAIVAVANDDVQAMDTACEGANCNPVPAPSATPSGPGNSGNSAGGGGNPNKPPVPSPSPVAGVDDAKEVHDFVCVLEGPGKSHKAAYLSDDQIESKVGTPRDICMSENACLKIVSEIFVVKGPEKRGFCPNKNPHVVEMSDAQIKALVAKMKK